MRACIVMIVFDMLFDVVVADASVGTVASLGFKANLAATFAKEGAVCLTAFADIDVMEAISAVLAEMRVVIRVLNAHGRHLVAIRIALTAVKAKLTKLTLLDGAVGTAAVRAEMLVPFGVLDAVFTAFTTLSVGIILTAEYAKAAIIAELDAVLVKTFVTLLADNTALLTVEVFVLTDLIGAVAVSALVTVHQLKFPTAFTEAATVAKTAHAVSAEPTIAAKVVLLVDHTLATAKAVPAFVDVALLTRHTV